MLEVTWYTLKGRKMTLAPLDQPMRHCGKEETTGSASMTWPHSLLCSTMNDWLHFTNRTPSTRTCTVSTPKSDGHGERSFRSSASLTGESLRGLLSLSLHLIYRAAILVRLTLITSWTTLVLTRMTSTRDRLCFVWLSCSRSYRLSL